MLTRRTMMAAPIVLFAARPVIAAQGEMSLCIHSNTSNGAGYRRALEGWAKAGIKNVELNAAFVEAFLKTDTMGGARKILADNGLTVVHGAVGVNGLLEPNPNHAVAIEALKKRLEMFAALDLKKVYTTAGGAQEITADDYAIVANQMRLVGDTVRAFAIHVDAADRPQSHT